MLSVRLYRRLRSQSLKDQGKSRTAMKYRLKDRELQSQSLKDQGKSRTRIEEDQDNTFRVAIP